VLLSFSGDDLKKYFIDFETKFAESFFLKSTIYNMSGRVVSDIKLEPKEMT
jgi:hypothetical protein